MQLLHSVAVLLFPVHVQYLTKDFVENGMLSRSWECFTILETFSAEA